jgi:putative intracellular protease/amidase
VPQEVVVDGNLITATGPSAAREFGERIITLLQG